MIDRKIRGGFYYRNDIWFSAAYQSLSISARNLLQCFLTELRYKGKGQKKQYLNNGNISYTAVDFKKRFNTCSSTYLNARNQLIKVGFIDQKYRGGMCRGDCAKYKLLVGTGLPHKQERWREYPEKNWENKIPKPKEQIIGVDTQWKKGQSGRKTKATVME